jgi:hypothetical protein
MLRVQIKNCGNVSQHQVALPRSIPVDVIHWLPFNMLSCKFPPEGYLAGEAFATWLVRFALPSSNPPFCNKNTLWPSEPSRSIRSLNASGSQKIRRPAAAFPRSRCQIEADRNTAARAEGTWKSYTESEIVLIY